ncbi:hypothetical protein Caci_5511 [Catenulispora acidiphila DSM 44928]|uniref:PIN domain-containing protein n=1 Tax=Catenulispora acidiphila (strain DSM 44928 / JCM 14897 / NBRC 102108 / NRRL B-24433 / ID139908) TaxID=479433 RepID=C7QAP7_CATAD|nr:type II toxin-antitoxin system VapC family toxin [Catenulispora acidiphila]ACU74370.1 hypothetical protein Caci_5511 [Catenulispora acidiphila DSM 44928]
MTTFERGQNLVGVQYYLDSNVLIDFLDNTQTPSDISNLLRFWTEGWIGLARTDVVDTERTDGQDDETVARRLAETADFPETYGPAVWGHSRWDRSYYATGEDEMRLNAVFAMLFPGKDRNAANKNDLRDAMHVSTAIRYAGYAFVTSDIKLVKKDSVIQNLSGSAGMRIWTPTQALSETRSRVAAMRKLHSLLPERGPLPEWPAEADIGQGANGGVE